LVGNQVAGEVLRGVHQAGDDCSAQIGSLEEVEESWSTAHLGFNLYCSLYHGQGLLGVFAGIGSETLN
jgi:hypothetical protein